MTDTLDELILMVNSEFDVDIREYTRKREVVSAKTIYVCIANDLFPYEDVSIMNKIGLHRTSLYPSIKRKEDLYGLDKEFTRMYDIINSQLDYLKEVKVKEQEKIKLNYVQSQYKELRDLAEQFHKSTVVRDGDYRRRLSTRMCKILDKLEVIENERIKSEV